MSATLRSAPEGRAITPNMDVRAIFLVGHMGAGKSSVGRALSAQMNWPFEDLDDRIEQSEGSSIEEIFREKGESEFRRLEHAVLRKILEELHGPPRVIALGGGAFVQPENARLLKQPGYVSAFLDGTAEEFFNRCRRQAVQRPLVVDSKQFSDLYEKRRKFFESATLRSDTTGRSIEDIASDLARELAKLVPTK